MFGISPPFHFGCYAQHVVVEEKVRNRIEYILLTRSQYVALKPNNCSFEEAASIPFCGITALQVRSNKKAKRPKGISDATFPRLGL